MLLSVVMQRPILKFSNLNAQFDHAHVVVVKQTASQAWLAQVMVKQRVNPVPVVDEQGCLVGIVSRADLVDMMAAQIE